MQGGAAWTEPIWQRCPWVERKHIAKTARIPFRSHCLSDYNALMNRLAGQTEDSWAAGSWSGLPFAARAGS
jgi:hypothetical protein